MAREGGDEKHQAMIDDLLTAPERSIDMLRIDPATGKPPGWSEGVSDVAP